MKCADILLSVLLHVGLVSGVMYGLLQDPANDIAEIQVEPIFFEILEESVIDSHSAEETSEGAVPTSEGPVPTSEGPVPTSEGPVPMVEGPVPTSEGPVPTVEGSVPMFAAIPVSVSVVEPPSIGHGSNLEEEGPVPLPPPSKMPVEAAEGVVSEKEGSVPMSRQERSRVVSEPRALNKIVPVYPRSARRRGREGIVMLEISVSDSGEVSDAAVIEGSGHKDLDSAAVSAVHTARFAPATEDGVKVQGRLRLTFEFKLK